MSIAKNQSIISDFCFETARFPLPLDVREFIFDRFVIENIPLEVNEVPRFTRFLLLSLFPALLSHLETLDQVRGKCDLSGIPK